MGDENPICTLGDYSKPSHEGYMNTIKLPVGNNVHENRDNNLHTYHNLWDIIVDGDLQEEAAPAGEQSGPPAPKTAKQLTAKRNQERAAIKSRFGGNDESKKMQRNVLKHQFENFTTTPNESLDKAYDRFQKLISQLEVHAAPVSKEDINQKFLRKLGFFSSVNTNALTKLRVLPVEILGINTTGGTSSTNQFHNVPNAKSLWDAIKSRFRGNDESKKMHRNVLKHQFENFTTAPNESLDKAYDRFQKLISQLEVYATPNTSNTNEVSPASGNFRVNTVGGTSSSSQVSSTPGADEVVCSFFAQQTTSPPLDNEDLQQIDQDDLEELDIRWQVAMLTVRVQRFIQKTGRNLDFKGKQPVTFDKSKVECYNCHRKGHFAKECKSGRNQGKRSYGDNGRRNATTNEPSSQALVAQDGLGGYDWSNDFDEPVNYALMAISSSSSSSSSDNEVQNCSKQCLESFKTLQKNFDSEREKHSRARLEIQGYELALESLESRILGHEKNELAWGEKYEFQNYELKCREVKINNLKMELEKVVKERDELKVKIEKWEESSKGLNKLLNSQMSAKDKNGLGYGTQLDEMSNKFETDSEISMSVFEVRSSDEDITPVNDRFSKADGYHAVPPPITGNFLTPRAGISFAGLDEYAIRKKIIKSKTSEPKDDTSKSKTSETVGKTNEVEKYKQKINRDKVIIEDWNSDDEDDVSEVNTVNPVKTNETQTVKTQVDKIGQISQKEGIGFKKIKACFICKSTEYLIKDCDFYAKKSSEPKLKTMVNTGQRVVKLVWDIAKRVNHQKISNKLKYPQARRTFVPSGVLSRTGLVNPVRLNRKRAVHTVSTARPISTARPVSTARPFAPKIAQTGSAIRPIYPRMDNVRPRASYSPIKRSYYTKPAFRPKNLKQDVKTSGVKNMTTAGTRAVVNTGKGKMDNALKKSRWVWRPKGNYMDHESKEKGSFILKKFEYGNPDICLQDHAVMDSGYSSHMTGNKAYLLEYEDYNGGFVAFRNELKFNLFSILQMCDKKNSVLFTDTKFLILSPSFKLLDENQVVLRAPRQNGVYSLDLKNIVPSRGITCLYANATIYESKLWHRRLGYVNFKNINKLVKGHLVRGLPSKVFVNDHTCVACKKGKQHKASCKAKLERTIKKPLELLHIDLFGPVLVESINKKKYCLVVTDDFSKFSWVFFLATKDETNEILYKFITCLENQLNHKVKIIRSDHGTEFKNHAMNEFCAKKEIKREFSVVRTLHQNGVAEKNRTLIEAARTMLADSLLPIPFWAEAVNTACYVLNRVLMTKHQNKTLYELLIGKPPSISFMRPFGCPLTILNTLDPLGKFDGKSDEGYLLGYSTTSKAFRVYNKRTKRVEENMHIDFLEDQPNVAGSGPDWMFDLDFLTNTMNYIPVSVENQVNMDACTQEHYAAGSLEKDKEPTQEYILLPLHPHRPRISVEDVVQAVQEKPSETYPKDTAVQDSEDVAEKEEQHMLTEADQSLKDDLERMIAQEIIAKTMNDATRQAFKEEKKRAAQATSINKLNTSRPSVGASNSPLVSTANTPYASAASTPTSANTGGSSFVYLRGQIPIDASTLPNADLPIDPNMPNLEDDYNVFPNDDIFSGAYDDEDVGADADFNNMDNTIDVSPIPTLRVHKDHPKGQILGDPKSAVQIRGTIQKASSIQQALVSYIHNQNRTNHKDHQNCMLTCFLSQEEPKMISQAFKDESWVEAMQEELLQFKL
ncbi:putative ribonuclease H-like domain-containing protein [Tanacetum coccineum]